MQESIQHKIDYTKSLSDIYTYQINCNESFDILNELKKIKEEKEYYINEKLKLKYAIDAYQKQLIDVKMKIAKLDITKEQEIKYNEQKACLYELIETLENRINLFTHFIDTFGKYKTWIYNEKLLPAIVYKTNDILKHLFNGREQLCFNLEFNDILFTVIDEGNKIHMEKLSGAQSFAVSLSFRLALSSVGITRFRCDQLFIDEGFCSFDQNNLLNVPDLIKNLKQLYNEIIK